MKTLATRPPADGSRSPVLPPAMGETAVIVRLADHDAADGGVDGTADAAAGTDPVARARGFAEPLLAGRQLDSGEDALAHAEGVAALLQAIGAAPSMRAAAYLVYAGDYLQRPEEVVAKAFGESAASLVALTRKLVQIQRAARSAVVGAEQRALQTERVRKMLLAFSRDLRVVLLRLASRLQTLRWFAASRTPCPEALARESLQVFAPLANRLGIWQIKWEIEDLAFRFLQPADYRRVAGLLDQTRVEREAGIAAARATLTQRLAEAGLHADVQGRPKHLYSIWKKMQGKGLGFERVFDVRALRVVVDDVGACYAALARVHELFAPVPGEFDDYIAKPKPNGYQSLHTVVLGDDGRPLEAASPPQATSRSASPKPARPCCANCWPGSATPRRTPLHRPARPSTTASTSSPRRPPSSTCRSAPRRSTLPTACTPISGTAAAAPVSMGRWCR
jgi:GTP pyrophosphokinase